MEKALGSNKSLTQRCSPLHLVLAVGLLSMLFTHRHIHLLFIPNYLPSLILTPRVNEVGVRGRESGGLMDLIKGVALIISGETTRYGLSKEEKERGKKGVGGRGGDNKRYVSVHSGNMPLRGRRQKSQRKTERAWEKRWRRLLSCHRCSRYVTLVYLHQCIWLTREAISHVWAEWNSMFTKG